MRNTPRPQSLATRRALAMARAVKTLTRSKKQRIAKLCGIHVATLYRALSKANGRA